MFNFMALIVLDTLGCHVDRSYLIAFEQACFLHTYKYIATTTAYYNTSINTE